MGILDRFRKKEPKRTAPYGVMNTEIPCTGVTLDDMSHFDLKTIEKTVEKKENLGLNLRFQPVT